MGSTGTNKGNGSGGQFGGSSPIIFNEVPTSGAPMDIYKLQQEMGQTGYEAGDPNATPNNKLYVNTGKSMNINAYLLSDGKTFYSSDSNWNGLINESWIKNSIKQIDSGMKPLSQSIQTYRFMDAEALGKVIGVSSLDSTTIEKTISELQNGKSFANSFKKLLKNVDYTHKAYTSTTYVPEHGSYGSKAVMLNIVAQKGTPAIVTNNHKEHEILLGKNIKYKFTGGWSIRKVKNKNQLVLDVVI